ncbi:ribosome small subunit-dependent GTPase A [Brucepastera parasyntrophica]|nr:ribosome small subunit-dependent GTPase A [Brucepastera parasyntrophica]ULQ59565.1 ribosome small subunit-dependent GTPase A [Brucepastera parasyntrophica]
MTEGLVLCGTNNQFEVETADGTVRLCPIKGKILKESKGYYNPLAPGDRVLIEPDEQDSVRGLILSLLPRENGFVRWNQKGKAPQLLAANLDLLVIVITPDEPPFRPRFVDRVLIQADAEHIVPLILVNKSDLGFPAGMEDRLSDWGRLGYRIMTASAKTGDHIPELASVLAGKLSAFVGQSGVGKSSLLNALDKNLDLRTNVLSEKYGRGTHTTTKGRLIRIGESISAASVIDTPGIRRFILHDIPAKDLALYFREMEDLVGSCTWGLSCTHEHESGCSILKAVSEKRIHEERYESWQRIREEIEIGSWAD